MHSAYSGWHMSTDRKCTSRAVVMQGACRMMRTSLMSGRQCSCCVKITMIVCHVFSWGALGNAFQAPTTLAREREYK